MRRRRPGVCAPGARAAAISRRWRKPACRRRLAPEREDCPTSPPAGSIPVPTSRLPSRPWCMLPLWNRVDIRRHVRRQIVISQSGRAREVLHRTGQGVVQALGQARGGAGLLLGQGTSERAEFLAGSHRDPCLGMARLARHGPPLPYLCSGPGPSAPGARRHSS